MKRQPATKRVVVREANTKAERLQLAKEMTLTASKVKVKQPEWSEFLTAMSSLIRATANDAANVQIAVIGTPKNKSTHVHIDLPDAMRARPKAKPAKKSRTEK